MTFDQIKSMERKIADWRKKSGDEKRTIWHEDLAKRVQDSMAMENEPVSEKWVRETEKR